MKVERYFLGRLLWALREAEGNHLPARANWSGRDQLYLSAGETVFSTLEILVDAVNDAPSMTMDDDSNTWQMTVTDTIEDSDYNFQGLSMYMTQIVISTHL